jgi:hypothetical protein
MEIAQIMDHFNVTVTDLVQLLILIAAVITVVNSYGSRIKALEKEVESQQTRCAAAMESVVPKPVLNAKLEKLAGEMVHLNNAQKALFQKVDDIYKLLLEAAKGH